MNRYIPYDMTVSYMEQAWLKEVTTERRNRELDRIGNTFDRISEQLQVLHETVRPVSASRYNRLRIAVAAIVLLTMSLMAHAQDKFRTMIVHAQGVTLTLHESDIRYVLAHSHSHFVNDAIALHPQTISNCEVADAIIAIIRKRDRDSVLGAVTVGYKTKPGRLYMNQFYCHTLVALLMICFHYALPERSKKDA